MKRALIYFLSHARPCKCHMRHLRTSKSINVLKMAYNSHMSLVRPGKNALTYKALQEGKSILTL